ncbi:hypothetical protein [Piscirickettsia salmonis]|uniref:hypothetical protein n=2 Tax=Piscirickettsia salmonis TaxID=1238 RepID=UPI00031356B2|nr:hypothetical protein [Piscirickettsia salmonis]QGN77966.1 hypothetical protein Psal001_02186 [Piscirickettsia salmonis]QGN81548.1 hypothetical protein Psal002_02203 [Piscirickettsia salmonis]QGN84179.1 hypothetical protein Psal003_01228 [Piscirickettsia salmonis]QGN87690.1 hypothetical protein Psal004_01225 [Piscirickettsia salmonis]QGN92179.1 hypothetical protein Psal005_02227 [Piscirickettsia salmonis]
MPTFTKVVLWDFDGPINYYNPDCSDTHHIPKGPDMPPELGISINYPDHIGTVLKILHANGVLSVPASQRCAYADDAREAGLKTAMYRSLNECFGTSREYLLEKHGETIAAGVDADNTGRSKNPYLDRVSDITGCEGIVPEDIILVDDNPKYQAPAEAAGYQFLLVSREDDINLVYKDKAYLIQVMRKAGLSDKQILAGIVKNADNRDVRIDLLDIYMKIGPHSTEGFGLAKQIKARDQELQHAYYPKLAVLEHHCVEHGEILADSNPYKWQQVEKFAHTAGECAKNYLLNGSNNDFKPLEDSKEIMESLSLHRRGKRWRILGTIGLSLIATGVGIGVPWLAYKIGQAIGNAWKGKPVNFLFLGETQSSEQAQAIKSAASQLGIGH